MSFNAGSIVGSLTLDLSPWTKAFSQVQREAPDILSGFTGSILQAQGIASVFPSVITSFMVNPMLGLAQVAKSVAGLVVEGAKAMVAAFKEVAAAADEAGNSAQKLGVDVSFLTSLRSVSAGAGVSKQSVDDSLKFLQKNASDAVGGDESAQKSFARIGIGVDQLKGSLNDVQKLFFQVGDGIKGLGSASDRTAVSMELLGRGGSEMIPVFLKGSTELQRWMDTIRQVGGDIDGRTAEMASKFSDLGVVWDAVWNGMKKAIAEPFLEFFAGNFDEVVALLKDAGVAIGDLFRSLKPVIKEALDYMLQMAQVLRDLLNSLADVSVAVNNFFGGTAQRGGGFTAPGAVVQPSGRVTAASEVSPQPQNVSVQVDVSGNGLDERQVARQVERSLRDWKQSQQGQISREWVSERLSF